MPLAYNSDLTVCGPQRPALLLSEKTESVNESRWLEVKNAKKANKAIVVTSLYAGGEGPFGDLEGVSS